MILLSLILIIIFSGCTQTRYKVVKLPELEVIPVKLTTNISGGLDRKNTMKAFVTISAYRKTIELHNRFKRAVEEAQTGD